MRGRTRASGPADSLDDDISAPLDPRLTFENFVVERVRDGQSIIGLYPATDESNLDRFAEWRKERGR